MCDLGGRVFQHTGEEGGRGVWEARPVREKGQPVLHNSLLIQGLLRVTAFRRPTTPNPSPQRQPEGKSGLPA